MPRDLRLAYEPCGMTAEDQSVSVTICVAPLDRILPVVTGLFRARHGATTLGEPVGHGPHGLYRLEQDEAERTSRRTGAWVLPYWPLVVSEPEGRSDITLVEDHGNHWIAAGLARFRPGTLVLSIRSRFDRATGESHEMTLRRGTRILRRIAATRDDQGRWHVDASGRPTEWEGAVPGRAPGDAIDRAGLFAICAAFGVDLQAALGRRRLRRAISVQALDTRNPDGGLPPARLGQATYEAALRAGFGAGEIGAHPLPPSFQDSETVDIAAIESEVQRRISRARTVEDIREALQRAAVLSNGGRAGRQRLGALYSLGVARAYRIDLDCLTTRRLERDWSETMAATDFPVCRQDIEQDRMKVRRSMVLRPLARRHEAICAAARDPAELLAILNDVETDPLPEVDARFAEMALSLALKRARELDGDNPATALLADALQSHQRPAARAQASAQPGSARPLRRSRA